MRGQIDNEIDGGQIDDKIGGLINYQMDKQIDDYIGGQMGE